MLVSFGDEKIVCFHTFWCWGTVPYKSEARERFTLASKMNPVEAEDFTVNMVNHKYSLEDIASIIKDNTYLLEQ
jgi:hypothetical protein